MRVPPNHPSHETILVLKPMVTWGSPMTQEPPKMGTAQNWILKHNTNTYGTKTTRNDQSIRGPLGLKQIDSKMSLAL